MWLYRSLVMLGLLLLVAAGIFFGASQYAIDRTVDIALPDIRGVTDPASVTEGARLAHVEGCVACHGNEGQGRVMYNRPGIAHVVAPALSRIASQATDEQLARAIRNGVSIHAKPLFMMPVHALNRLSDDDVARLVGWMRSLEPTPGDMLRPKEVGLAGRLDLLLGKFKPSVVRDSSQPRTRPSDMGRYLVETSCEQCHDLAKSRMMADGVHIAPALVRAASAYDPEAFRTLLLSGRGVGGHDLSVMRDYAGFGFFALHDDEVAAIQAYLKRRAAGAKAG